MHNNLEYYKIFYYVAKHNSISAAAGELCLSQPAVSQTIKLLEQSCQTKLFVRQPRGVRLTPEGEVLFRFISEGYEKIEQGETLLRQMVNMESGEIRIGASDMTLQYYLLPYLQAFYERYPGIAMRITNGPTPETMAYLSAGKIDFGVISGPVTVSDEYQLLPVREIGDIFVAGDNFKYLKDTVLNYSELEKVPLICLEGETTTGRYVSEFLHKQGTSPVPEFALATSGMIVQFALRGLGIGAVVDCFADEYLKSGQLFCLQFHKPVPKRQLYIITKERNPMSKAAKALLTELIPVQ